MVIICLRDRLSYRQAVSDIVRAYAFLAMFFRQTYVLLIASIFLASVWGLSCTRVFNRWDILERYLLDTLTGRLGFRTSCLFLQLWGPILDSRFHTHSLT